MSEALKKFKVKIQTLMERYPNTSLFGSEQTMLEKFQRMGEFTDLESKNVDLLISDALRDDTTLTLKVVKMAFTHAAKKHFSLA